VEVDGDEKPLVIFKSCPSIIRDGDVSKNGPRAQNRFA